MDFFSKRSRVLPLRAMVQASLVVVLALAGCRPAADSQPASSVPAADESTDTASAPELVAPAESPASTSDAVAPAPGSTPDDLFTGWYFEQGGAARLQACGQAAPLEVADPAFLRQLKARLGGPPKPTYVRLRVRLAPGSKLEVSEVEQFGVDEGPTPDCALVAPKN